MNLLKTLLALVALCLLYVWAMSPWVSGEPSDR